MHGISRNERSLRFTMNDRGRFQDLEHFHCCWVSRKRSAAALSLRKTPIDAEALLYTYSENARAAEQISSDYGRT